MTKQISEHAAAAKPPIGAALLELSSLCLAANRNDDALRRQAPPQSPTSSSQDTPPVRPTNGEGRGSRSDKATIRAAGTRV